MVLFTAVSFTACDTEPVDPELVNNPNNPDNPNNPNPEQGVFKVDFNGETHTATTTTAAVNNGVLAISGIVGPNGAALNIAVPAPSVGTFSGEEVILAYQPANSEYGYLNVNFDGNPPYSGTVVISSIDTANQTVSGTFEFTGWWSNDQEEMDPIVFTNGSFTNISYAGAIPGDEDVVTANLNGEEFPVESVIVAIAGSGTSETININAYDADLNRIFLSINADLNPGTYTITSDPLAEVGAEYSEGGLTYEATTGTLVITSKTETRIKGTFEFTGMNGEESAEVTIGNFDVAYDF